MITLYGFGAGFGLPEISPFVTKTEVQLKMAGLAYRKERAKPPASPKGQLPYIVDEAETIADSTFIRAHIERKYGFDFDRGLDFYKRLLGISPDDVRRRWIAVVFRGTSACAKAERTFENKHASEITRTKIADLFIEILREALL